MRPAKGEWRALLQELYLLDFTSAVYGTYQEAVRDPGGRHIFEDYLRLEAERRRRIEDHLTSAGASLLPLPGLVLRAAGRVYGRLTSLLGTRLMLRIALSASRRASRRACASLGEQARPDLIYLATLRAKSEGELCLALRQRLIDTRTERARK